MSRFQKRLCLIFVYMVFSMSTHAMQFSLKGDCFIQQGRLLSLHKFNQRLCHTQSRVHYSLDSLKSAHKVQLPSREVLMRNLRKIQAPLDFLPLIQKLEDKQLQPDHIPSIIRSFFKDHILETFSFPDPDLTLESQTALDSEKLCENYQKLLEAAILENAYPLSIWLTLPTATELWLRHFDSKPRGQICESHEAPMLFANIAQQNVICHNITFLDMIFEPCLYSYLKIELDSRIPLGMILPCIREGIPLTKLYCRNVSSFWSIRRKAAIKDWIIEGNNYNGMSIFDENPVRNPIVIKLVANPATNWRINTLNSCHGKIDIMGPKGTKLISSFDEAKLYQLWHENKVIGPTLNLYQNMKIIYHPKE